jgi:DNA (cytosine-5)-methyltransferase 3A
LFVNYRTAKEKFKPDFFLYENNKSASQAIKDKIAEELGVGVDPKARFTYINSALVSAQNRQRFYVTNFGDIEQPEDRGILLRDILETGNGFGTMGEKGFALTATYGKGDAPDRILEKHQRTMVAIPVNTASDGKSHTLKAQYYKNAIANFVTNKGFDATAVAEPVNPLLNGKGRTVTAGYANKGAKHILESNYSDNPHKQTWDSVAEPIGYATPVEWDENGKPTKAISGTDGKTYTVYEVKDGLITIKGKQYSIDLADGYYIIRKLTVAECARLQTMPDDYCRAVSDSQAYKALGNGWTAEVIIHLLNHALKDVPRDEEIIVLSMYDGIATGRYCLDKMGFTNVKYHAYEIDPYPIKVAMDNYLDIIQHGDAFAVRKDEWKPPQTRSEWLNGLLGGS